MLSYSQVHAEGFGTPKGVEKDVKMGTDMQTDMRTGDDEDDS